MCRSAACNAYSLPPCCSSRPPSRKSLLRMRTWRRATCPASSGCSPRRGAGGPSLTTSTTWRGCPSSRCSCATTAGSRSCGTTPRGSEWFVPHAGGAFALLIYWLLSSCFVNCVFPCPQAPVCDLQMSGQQSSAALLPVLARSRLQLGVTLPMLLTCLESCCRGVCLLAAGDLVSLCLLDKDA
jgi:hypothetical protein